MSRLLLTLTKPEGIVLAHTTIVEPAGLLSYLSIVISLGILSPAFGQVLVRFQLMSLMIQPDGTVPIQTNLMLLLPLDSPPGEDGVGWERSSECTFLTSKCPGGPD